MRTKDMCGRGAGVGVLWREFCDAGVGDEAQRVLVLWRRV
jgi:hypothetical protein